MMEEYSYFGCGRRERSFGDLTKDHFNFFVCVGEETVGHRMCGGWRIYKKKNNNIEKQNKREREEKNL